MRDVRAERVQVLVHEWVISGSSLQRPHCFVTFFSSKRMRGVELVQLASHSSDLLEMDNLVWASLSSWRESLLRLLIFAENFNSFLLLHSLDRFETLNHFFFVGYFADLPPWFLFTKLLLWINGRCLLLSVDSSLNSRWSWVRSFL